MTWHSLDTKQQNLVYELMYRVTLQQSVSVCACREVHLQTLSPVTCTWSCDNHMITDLPCLSSPVWVEVCLEGLWEQTPAKALENASVSEQQLQTDLSHAHCINERSHSHYAHNAQDCIINFVCTNVQTCAQYQQVIDPLPDAPILFSMHYYIHKTYKVAPSHDDDDGPMGFLDDRACCRDNGVMLSTVNTSMVALMWKWMATSSGISGFSWFCTGNRNAIYS